VVAPEGADDWKGVYDDGTQIPLLLHYLLPRPPRLMPTVGDE
jgi:hypothetical protein